MLTYLKQVNTDCRRFFSHIFSWWTGASHPESESRVHQCGWSVRSTGQWHCDSPLLCCRQCWGLARGSSAWGLMTGATESSPAAAVSQPWPTTMSPHLHLSETRLWQAATSHHQKPSWTLNTTRQSPGGVSPHLTAEITESFKRKVTTLENTDKSSQLMDMYFGINHILLGSSKVKQGAKDRWRTEGPIQRKIYEIIKEQRRDKMLTGLWCYANEIENREYTWAF